MTTPGQPPATDPWSAPGTPAGYGPWPTTPGPAPVPAGYGPPAGYAPPAGGYGPPGYGPAPTRPWAPAVPAEPAVDTRVPPGPGVRPPFAAPPSERSKTRMWVGIALAAVLTVVCCAGGIFGFAATTVSATKQQSTLAEELLTTYLTALVDGRYRDAYRLNCADYRDQVPLEEFTDRWRDPTLDRYVVGEAVYGNPIAVPATLRFSDDSTSTASFDVGVDITGDLRVCGYSGT